MKMIALVFDMDGTLIYVKNSYKEAIVKTVQYFINDAKREDIKTEIDRLIGVKSFNNDWDSAYYIIQKLSGKEPKVIRDDFWRKMRRIFQAYYLGSGLYKISYRSEPSFDIEKGLIENEYPLITVETLDMLAPYSKGIVTSRPRLEAEYTLRKNYLSNYFDIRSMITLDDVENEKPHPESLLKMKEMLNGDEYFYIGDTVDDAIAAKKAGYTSVIIGGKWGDIQIKDINELPDVINLYGNM